MRTGRPCCCRGLIPRTDSYVPCRHPSPRVCMGRRGPDAGDIHPLRDHGGMGIAIWLKGMRPQTLPASVAPVVIGAAAAWTSIRQLGVCILTYPAPESCAINRATQTTLESRFWPLAILCTLVALFLQIAVNFANDYSDGVRGVDEGRGAASARVARVAGIILVGRTDRHPTRGGRPLGPARRHRGDLHPCTCASGRLRCAAETGVGGGRRGGGARLPVRFWRLSRSPDTGGC